MVVASEITKSRNISLDEPVYSWESLLIIIKKVLPVDYACLVGGFPAGIQAHGRGDFKLWVAAVSWFNFVIAPDLPLEDFLCIVVKCKFDAWLPVQCI